MKILESKTSFPVLNKTLNNALVFPNKIPKTDLVHLSNQFLGRIGAKNRPSIITCQDIIPLMLPKDYPLLLRVLLKYSISEMKKCNKILATSNFTARLIKKEFGFGNEVQAIHLGIDSKIKSVKKQAARKKLGIEKQKIILNVGSEEPRKNIPTVLNAFKQVLASEKNAALVRIGEKRENTARQIKELDLEEKVVYKTGISKEELNLWYNASDALLFPSYYEGFGLPVLEAMACKTPVICAALTSIPEISEKSCIEVKDAFNRELFAEKILEVFSDEKKAKKIGEKEFRQSKNFSWKKCAELTKKEYRKFVEV